MKLVSSYLGNDRLRTGRIYQIVSNLSQRNGGYTSVKKLRFRKGDNSLESVLFFKDDNRFKNEWYQRTITRTYRKQCFDRA